MNKRGRPPKACRPHGHVPAYRCPRCVRRYNREYRRIERQTQFTHPEDANGNLLPIPVWKVCGHPRTGANTRWSKVCLTCNPPKRGQ